MTEEQITRRRSLFAATGIAVGTLAYGAMPAHAEDEVENYRCVPPIMPPLNKRALNKTAQDGYPGAKWHPDGAVRHFPGLTFVSPLDDGAFKDAMIGIRQRILDRSLGSLYALLPPDTYHVTIVANGPVDSDRSDDKWPSIVPTDISIPEMAREFATRITDASLPKLGEIRMAPFEIGKQTKTSGIGVGFRVDDRDRSRLIEFELAIVELLGLPAPKDNDYRWHSTLGDKLDEPSDRELPELEEWRQEFLALLPEELILRRHEFNIFDNMTGFSSLYDFK